MLIVSPSGLRTSLLNAYIGIVNCWSMLEDGPLTCGNQITSGWPSKFPVRKVLCDLILPLPRGCTGLSHPNAPSLILYTVGPPDTPQYTNRTSISLITEHVIIPFPEMAPSVVSASSWLLNLYNMLTSSFCLMFLLRMASHMGKGHYYSEQTFTTKLGKFDGIIEMWPVIFQGVEDTPQSFMTKPHQFFNSPCSCFCIFWGRHQSTPLTLMTVCSPDWWAENVQCVQNPSWCCWWSSLASMAWSTMHVNVSPCTNWWKWHVGRMKLSIHSARMRWAVSR